MRKIMNKIKNQWFIKTPPERLAVLRIATGCFSLWYLLSRFDMLQRMAKNTETFEPIGILSWINQPLSENVFWWISIGVIILNVLYIIGWKFKFTGPAFALVVLLYFTYRNSWSMIYHNRNALVLHIIIIGLVASADAWSWDSWRKKRKGIKSPEAHWQYGWPIQLICAATVGTYLLSGIAKLAGDLAWDWANGSGMRSQVAIDAIRKELLGAEAAPLFEVLYEHTWLFLGMGILTFVLELGAPLALARKRWAMIWAGLTWMMHWGIFFIMGISFRYQMTGLIFISFFDVEKLWISSRKIQPKISQIRKGVDLNSKPIILFDGVCNLCNGWIRFILKREKHQLYQFASLQSGIGKKILSEYGLSNNLTSIVLIENKNAYQKSDAILRIFGNLNDPWRIVTILFAIPRMIRNVIYDLVAVNRHKWFGKQQQCELITSDQKVRFLDL